MKTSTKTHTTLQPKPSPCPVLSCPVLSCPVLSCPVLSYPVLSCPALPYPVWSCPILSWPALSCPVLSYPVLSCPVLSWKGGALHYPLPSKKGSALWKILWYKFWRALYFTHMQCVSNEWSVFCHCWCYWRPVSWSFKLLLMLDLHNVWCT